jgi:hypothetical protein
MALSITLSVLLMVQMPGTYANGKNMPNALFHIPEAPGPDKIYGDNPIYTVGETVEFRWFSRYDKVGIFIWQQYPNLDAGTSKSLVCKLFWVAKMMSDHSYSDHYNSGLDEQFI